MEKSFTVILKEIVEEINKELGPGFSESVYQSAIAVDLQKRGIFYDKESYVLIYYKEVNVGFNRMDFVVVFNDKKYIIELKAQINNPSDIERKQLKNYLKWANIHSGYLINFPQVSKKGIVNDLYFEKLTKTQ